MRKFGFILLALVCFLSLAAGGSHSHASGRRATETLCQGHGAADEWLCERQCNSDLNLPRIPTATTPVETTVPASHRGMPSARPAGAWLRFTDFACGRGAQETRISEFPIRFPFRRPADRYVYRLRRIVI